MPALSWLGDSAARRAARHVPYRILEPVETIGDPASENLLIQGDNLQALKALLPFYAGRVKCIFIDPPYNTKSAFEHYDDNLEHSQWLSMIYPRLELLRELLSENGSIWVTIDDNEGHYLKALMDEVLGRSRFVATVAWESRYSRSNDSSLSISHNFILVYATDPDRWKAIRNRLPRTELQAAQYTNPDGDPRGPWRAIPWDAPDLRPNLTYPITTPTGKVRMPPPGRHWSRTEDQWEEIVAAGLAYFGKSGNGAPSFKQFLSEAAPIVPNTWWSHEDAGHTDEAKKEIQTLFGAENLFATPKPERLIRRIAAIATNPGDIVLDSFLGSGTTAAVAHKMGRRWIGIEMGEHARTHCLPRLQKVIDGEQGGISEAVGWKGGGGFRFMKLGAKAFFEDGALNADIKARDLAAFIWFAETKRPHDVAELRTPYLGSDSGTAYVLLYNGLIGDRRPESGNVLTTRLWSHIETLLPADRRDTVIYGEACHLSKTRLRELGVTFKQIPYDIAIR